MLLETRHPHYATYVRTGRKGETGDDWNSRETHGKEQDTKYDHKYRTTRTLRMENAQVEQETTRHV